MEEAAALQAAASAGGVGVGASSAALPPSCSPPGGPAAGLHSAEASVGRLLGLMDPDLGLDGFKDEARDVVVRSAKRERPKLTHALLFDDDRGFKKILKTFPKIKFQGKGREFEDLTLLLRNYDQWFKELHPVEDSLEGLAWKAKELLVEKGRDAEDKESDPVEKLLSMRVQYKYGRKDSDKSTKTDEVKQTSQEAKLRIEENRRRALERKRRRESAMPAAPAVPTDFPEEEEDPFGFAAMAFDTDGAGMNKTTTEAKAQLGFTDEELFGPPEIPGPETLLEEDLFGPSAPQADEPPDEDVFGFGCGFDE